LGGGEINEQEKMRDFKPNRIVCLTEETVETLYLLGEQDRVVGVTGYAVRPPEVRKEKVRVGAFTSADIPKILSLNPDLVLTFSDLQADIAAELISKGIDVHAFNQRSVEGILSMISMIGSLVGASKKSEELISGYAKKLETLRKKERKVIKVYIEEWDEPMISGILWFSELVQIAGGVDVFSDKSKNIDAKSRILEPDEVIKANPDVIIASWCGKKVRKEKIAARRNWKSIPAVKNDLIFEIKSPLILQPGPAALGPGLDQICWILDSARDRLRG
jgi:iron complex transport system substrate-binding protein